MEGLIVRSDKHYTYEDYLKLDDDQEYEVIGGKLIVVPKPRLYHQKIADDILTEIKVFLRQNSIGIAYSNVDVVFGKQVVSPDIIFISNERLSIATETNVQGAPDLVVEVLSPSTKKYDRKEKWKLYYENGVKEYWIFDPLTQLVETFISGAKDWERAGIYDDEDILTSPLLPGLAIELKKVF